MSELLAAILGIAGKVLDKVMPDPAAKAAAQFQLLQLAQAGELAHLESETKSLLGQLDINRADAQSGDHFQSRWRPFIGWVCGSALAYEYLAQPMLAWASGWFHMGGPPMLQLQDLLAILTGMLGLGGLRTAEKLSGKAG